MNHHTEATSLDALSPERRRTLLVRTVLVTALSAGAVLLAYVLAPLTAEPGDTVAVRFVIALVLTLGALVCQLRAVIVAPVPQLRVVQTFGFSVPLVVVLFAALHVVLSRSDAGAYSEQLDHVGGLYYSATTATTVGFGDISAKSNAARIAVMVQMVVQVVALGFAVRLAMASVRERTSR